MSDRNSLPLQSCTRGIEPETLFLEIKEALRFRKAFAHQTGLFSNQFWDELRVYSTLYDLMNQGEPNY